MAFDKSPNNYAATQVSQISSVGTSSVPEKRPKWNFESPAGTITWTSISSNNVYIGIGTEQGYVYLFNTSSKAVLDNIYIGGHVDALAVSDNGEYIAVATGNLVVVYKIDVEDLKYLWNFTNDPGDQEGGIYSLSLSANGSILSVGTWFRIYYQGGYYHHGYSYVYLFDTITGTQMWNSTVNHAYDYREVTDYVCVDISADGQYIVAGSTWQPKVYLFNETSSIPIYSPFPESSAVKQVSFDTKFYVAGSGDLLQYFDVDNPGPLWTQNLGEIVTSVSISLNGSRIVASTQNLFALFNNSGTMLGDWTFEVGSSSSYVAISSNGKYSIAKSNQRIYFFSNDVDANPKTPSYDPLWLYDTGASINSVSISSDGMYVLAGSGKYLYLFDATYNPDLTPAYIQFSNENPVDGEAITIYARIDNNGNLDSPSQSVRFYDNDILVGTTNASAVLKQSYIIISIQEYVSSPGSHQVRVVVDCYNIVYESNETNNLLAEEIVVESFPLVDTGANPVVTEASQAITSIAVSGDGYYTAFGTNDGYVYLFFKNHTTPIWSFSAAGSISKVAISRDGSYIAASTGNTLHVFSRLSDIPIWNFTNNPGSQEGGVHSISFSANGSVLAVGTWFRIYYQGGYYHHGYSYVHLFDTVTGTSVWDPSPITNHAYDYREVTDYVCVDISADGQYIVAGSTWQPKVYIFHKGSSEPMYPAFSADSSVNSISMSANGQYYVVGTLKLYYFSKDDPGPQRVKSFQNPITSVSTSDDGTYLTATNQTHLLVFRNDLTLQWDYPLPQGRAKICPDGNYVAAQSSDYAYLFPRSIGSYEWMYPTQGQPVSISISFDGRYSTYTSGNKMIFFDLIHKADLTPTNIIISKSQPNEGDIIKIDATISNIGSFKSYYVPIQLFDNNTLVGSKEIGSLSPGASMNVSINYVCQARQRMLRIHVNSWLTQTYESNYTNNDITTSLYVNARPANVTLNKPTTINSTSIELAWTQNLDADFARYEIYASIYIGELGVLKETIVTQPTTQFVVSGLDASTTYYFTVRVVDSGGAFSNSNQDFGTTLPNPVTLNNPANPRTTSLDLSWTENTDDNFKSYKIYYSTSIGDVGSLLAEISNNQSKTTYTATGLKASTAYYFTVYVTNVQGLSSVASNKARGVTLPIPVTLNNPTSMTLSSMTLTWTRNTDSNFQKYEIYRSRSATTLGELIASITDQSVTTHVASGLNSSTTYYFVVKVVGLDGLTSPSNQVYGTTLGPGWDFTISISPTSQIAMRGGSASYTITVTGFGEKSIGKSVTLSVSGLPAGATYQFSSTSVTTNHTSTLTVTISSFTEEDTYTLTIVATSGELTKSDTVDLIVKSEEVDYSRWIYVLSGIAITAIVAAAVLLKKRKHK